MTAAERAAWAAAGALATLAALAGLAVHWGRAVEKNEQYGTWQGRPSVRYCARHEPDRRSDVAAWIRRHRESYAHTGKFSAGMCWQALDSLLHDYRLHADTGTPLDQEAPDWPGHPL